MSSKQVAAKLPTAKRIVVKIGTSTLTGGGSQLRPQNMLAIVEQVAKLHQHGHEIILVSSGAQAAGRGRLNSPELPRSVPAKQMLSAVGQSYLMRHYSDLFDIFDVIVAQILLTRDDLSIRSRYLNARDTLLTLIEQRIIPIINENDTVATDEIRVGDNDNLSALVASVLEADLLVLLTDQPGLYTADPRQDPEAELIPTVPRIDTDVMKLAGGAGTVAGTGGMVTKLEAARTAARSGVMTIIASGDETNVLTRIASGELIGTRFEPTGTHRESRKRWLLTDRTQGAVYIDAGAERALLATDGASLLPVGITRIEGNFKRSATLSICGPSGAEIAHGLSNYASSELRQIMGKKSHEISDVLGYSYGDAAIHRNQMVLLD
ncbi:glutamate 5-kinase [Phototrophicus methaneseepsis]|uniref:Glutamate 5-kinase n=1 Tax=Phototrophicus methaneseepsis TaxID=2710758 RepID=A0A7S8E7U6_9CHLR|nr:glutamate 5-kinase [Phototrophicus methaneseepsis]QPC81950.1 glutamate 5-kinase [Phototrophicus methaneseepsis]